MQNITLNIKPEVALAFGLGTSLGSIGMALVARKGMKDLVNLTEKQSKRQQERFQYVMDKARPHLSNEELSEIVIYLQTDLMASTEEGLALGVPPEDDSNN